jgi:hypothetical protein
MTPLSLSRVADIAILHLAPHDHLECKTQVVAIEAIDPTLVWVVKTASFRRTSAFTGWLVVYLPDAPVAAHPGGECVQGFYCIDYVTEAAAFKAAKTLMGEAVS